MRSTWTLLLTLLSYRLALASLPAKRHYSTHDYYVLEHDPAGASLDIIAKTLDVEVVEQVGALQHFWLVRTEKPTLALRETSDRVLEHFDRLRTQAASEPGSHLSQRSDILQARDIVSSVKYISRQTLRQRAKRAPPPIRPGEEEELPSKVVADRLGITDPLFSQQWHLVNDEFPENMMNVTGLWELGITGKDVISALVDDGLDYESRDLKENFVRLSNGQTYCA
jgi:kexin